MTRIHKLLLVSALAVAGVWGCAKAPTAATGTDKQKQLEARVAKLELELKDAVVGRSQALGKLADTEARLAAAEAEVKALTARAVGAEKARDDFAAKLKAKAAERDQLQVQYDAFRKSLRELVGQAEATASAPAAGTAPIVAGLKPAGF